VEELVQWYLTKSFLKFKNQHSSNQNVVKLPPEERDSFIQAKFDQLFNMWMADVNSVRIEGKQLILTKGDFTGALENHLLRAYISLERIDQVKQEISKTKFSE
jgi:hypothetical protein